ncbi:SufD family Fe-S cluster assembly protein [Corynebacterium terpenotabidum]|uniref:SufBD protein n=1 Tax=Corynebacterium terpenotabidum Y-11 TaxID=1200352 RepID=S4XFW3_9CORY|nr:SufD family Fe-S cluster assembly protein [Corynebacterium terpenotabidum]AGP31464.1 SufBD protein [Corynebacterium terpenotabidum Y-11]
MSAPALPLPSVGPAAATPDLLAQVGWEDPATRVSTTVVVDHDYSAMDSSSEDVIVMPLAEALVTYPWVQDLVWSLVDPAEDEILRRAFESTRTPLGTFTWVKPGAKVEMPRQSFTVMTVPQERQFVHDITVIGDGAVVDSVSGAAVAPGLSHGTHVSVGETFIGDNVEMRSIDVDRWGSEMTVHTYDRTRIGENSRMSSVSIAVSGLKKARSTSVTEIGANSACSSHSIVFAPEGTDRGMEDQIVLTGPGAQAEVVARMVSDGGRITNASTLTSTSPDVRGFLECDGLLLRDGGGINSIPSLDAKVARAQLSHEASVGMIDDEKLDYLKALGMSEDSARDLIVQGFLNLEDDRIPASVRDRVAELVSAARGAEKM